MTVHELLTRGYRWADLHAAALFLGAVAWPLFGTLAAAAAKRVRSNADGRFLASSIIGVAVLAAFGESAAVSVAVGALHLSLLEANALLLISPVICLVGAVLFSKRGSIVDDKALIASPPASPTIQP